MVYFSSTKWTTFQLYYTLIEGIRGEEKAIRDEVVKAERGLRKEIQQQRNNAINYLLEKDMTVEQISEILNIPLKEVKTVSKKKKPKN